MTIFTIDWPMDKTLTLNGREHWAAKAILTKALRKAGADAVNLAVFRGEPATMARAHLRIDVGWPTRHQRDVSNWMPTFKAAIDGIVGDAKFLPGDDDRYLTGPDLRPAYLGLAKTVRMEFTFTEITESETP